MSGSLVSLADNNKKEDAELNNRQKKVLRDFVISLVLAIVGYKVAMVVVSHGIQNMAKVGQENIQRMNAKQLGQPPAGKE